MHATRLQLSKIDRLIRRSDFLNAQGKGKRWVSQGLILQTVPNETGRIRAGFTVSKKIDKSAVKRNRIRRRLKAASADILSLWARPGYDYVLVGRTASAARPYADLKSDLKWCLKKLELLDRQDPPAA